MLNRSQSRNQSPTAEQTDDPIFVSKSFNFYATDPQVSTLGVIGIQVALANEFFQGVTHLGFVSRL